MHTPVQYDLLIIGSGPAGTLLAWIMAKHGRRVLLLDRQQHPRFAVGESSTPIADSMLRELGETYDVPELVSLSRWGSWQRDLPQIGCGKKRGFSYFYHRRDADCIRDDVSARLLVAASPDDESSDTQWYRPDVDAYFAQQAQLAGVDLREQAEIKELKRGEDRWQIEYGWQGDCYRVSAEWIVDASGQGRVLAKALGLPDHTSRLWTRTCATYTHVTGCALWDKQMDAWGGKSQQYPFSADDAAQHHLYGNGWMWVLRFQAKGDQEAITSVGWTRSIERARKDPQATVDVNQMSLDEALGYTGYRSMQPLLAGARRAAMPGRMFHAPRLQHWVPRGCGEGFVMMPTTMATLDPLHSTGLAHALSGVRRVANILLGPSADRLTALQHYAEQVNAEIRLLDRMLSTAYLTMRSFDLFVPACMLYFAVAIRYEELRKAYGGQVSEAVWGADQTLVQQCVSEGCHALRQRAGQRAPRVDASLELLIGQQLRQLCQVPLYRPENQGLYGYTFAGG